MNGEGKGLIRLGQVTSRKRTAREPSLTYRKVSRRCQNHGGQKIVGSASAEPAYGRSDIRYTGGLSLEEAVVWNVGTWVSMLTEKLQVE